MLVRRFCGASVRVCCFRNAAAVVVDPQGCVFVLKRKRPLLAQATVGAADAMRVLGWTKQMFELYCAKADFGVRHPPPPHRATARRAFS